MFLQKEWTKTTAIAITIWTGVIVGFSALSYFVYFVDPGEIPNIGLHIGR